MLDTLEKASVLPVRDQVYGKLKSLVAADRSQVGQKLPTSRQLAKHFHVSLSTAQAALRMMEQEGLVSCEVGRGTYVTRTLPPEVVAESQRSVIPTIGVLTVAHEQFDLHHPGSDWTAGILYGIQQGLMEDGFALQLIPFYQHGGSIEEGQRRLDKTVQALSALVTFPFPIQDQLCPLLDRTGLPWITINQFNHRCTTNYVTADYYGGGVEAGKLFGELGLEKVLFLKQNVAGYSSLQKENGLRDGLSSCGISPSQIEVALCDSHLLHDGVKSMTRYLDTSKKVPQAIFTTGDLLALAAIKVCEQRGLRVPEDVAVVGSTGIEAGEHSTPTLSTIQLPMVEMGREAARMLLSLIRRKEKHTAGKIIPAHLVQRGSTPPLPAKGSTKEGSKT